MIHYIPASTKVMRKCDYSCSSHFACPEIIAAMLDLFHIRISFSKRDHRAIFFLLVFFAVSPLLTEARSSDNIPDSLFQESRAAMGTDFTILLYARDVQQARSLFEEAFLEIERVEQLLSAFRASSELSRINRMAARAPVTLDPEMTWLLGRVIEWSYKTGHAFDPAIGPLLDLWGFTSERSTVPRADEITEILQVTGTDKIELSVPNRTVAFHSSEVRLDSGAFGKGYALDQAAAVLKKYGITRALLSSGQSSYLALNAPPGKMGWRITVSDPKNADSLLEETLLVNSALSTSGGANRFVELSGKRFAHILDPRSGRPAELSILCTVVAPDALVSDILSTAVFVLGPDQGAQLIRSIPETRGLVVSGSKSDRKMVLIRWDDL